MCSYSADDIQNGGQYSCVPTLLTIFKMVINTLNYSSVNIIKKGSQHKMAAKTHVLLFC